MNELNQEITYRPGVGLDIGTAFICRCKEREDGTEDFLSERDAFYCIKPETATNGKIIEKSLRKRNAFVLKKDGMFYVVGQQAVDLANEKQSQVERPMKRGVLSADQSNSFGMIKVVIEALIGKASIENEKCVFCYPADPLDSKFKVVFHKQRLYEILNSLGYNPVGIKESEALVYSELEDFEYTGITVSFGAGMVNFSVSHMGNILLSAAVSQGGDFIDSEVADLFHKSETIIQAEKENGLNLCDPSEGISLDANDPNYEMTLLIRKAIVDHYDELIRYTVSHMVKQFNKEQESLPNFTNPVPIIISGGTSLPKNFLEKFDKDIRSRKLPFNIGVIRRATSPLTSVAQGCLIFSKLED